MGRKKKKPSKPWCWYCNREFDDEKILIQHQKAKHFKCLLCHKKLYTGPGLAIHCLQVHKNVIDKVPNALPNRNSIDVEIYGMEGIPAQDIREHDSQRHGSSGAAGSDDESTGSKTESSNQGVCNMPPMPGIMPGMPPMPGMHSLRYGAPPVGPMGPIPMGMPPNFMTPGGAMPMVGPMPGVPMMPPSTIATAVNAPAKPLFPAAVAQASTSSHIPVGTDFKPLVSNATRPTFPAYSGSSPSTTTGQPLMSQGSAPVLYNSEAASSSHGVPESKRLVPPPNATSKIVHPEEDISLEEIRAQLPQYRRNMGLNPMPFPGANPVLMNGMPMMRPGMGMHPGMPVAMTRMNTPFIGQAVYSQGPSFMPPMMGQGAPRPF